MAVIPLLDAVDGDVEAIGAANYLTIENGRLIGHNNTDGKGVVKAIEKLAPLKGQRVVMLGAGVTGRALAVELAWAGASHLTLITRREEQGREVAATVTRNQPPQHAVSGYGPPAPLPGGGWGGDAGAAGDADLRAVDQCDPGGGGISAGGGGGAGGGLSGGAPPGECGLPGLQALGSQPTDGSIQEVTMSSSMRRPEPSV